jgi:hypothetical protein
MCIFAFENKVSWVAMRFVLWVFELVHVWVEEKAKDNDHSMDLLLGT